MTTQLACDLDGSEYNLYTAFWAEPNEHFPSGWRATVHGAGGDVQALKRCGCGPCLELADSWAESLRIASRPPSPDPPPAPPKVIPVGPVADHVRRLLAGGMTRSELAVAAGLDKTTITRLLRRDVKRVAVDTADAVLAVHGRLRSVS